MNGTLVYVNNDIIEIGEDQIFEWKWSSKSGFGR